ncbi:hypothetical protein M405DRAFT_841663 [Rhizopogon salebrosus TDB-379]|nr:hypothetical protein M405DRAFT_841663 [Rhizopogon salebrosus TDB-379]
MVAHTLRSVLVSLLGVPSFPARCMKVYAHEIMWFWLWLKLLVYRMLVLFHRTGDPELRRSGTQGMLLGSVNSITEERRDVYELWKVVTPLEPSGGRHAGHQATVVPGDISYISLEKNINFSIQPTMINPALAVTYLGDFPWKSYEQCTTKPVEECSCAMHATWPSIMSQRKISNLKYHKAYLKVQTWSRHLINAIGGLVVSPSVTPFVMSES